MATAIMLIWTAVTTHLYQEHGEGLRAAINDTGNLARGFGENVGRTMAGVDQVMKVLRNAFTINPAEFDLARLAPAAQILDEATLQIGATDQRGRMTASNLPYAKLLDLSDRKHIKVQMELPDDKLYISAPVIGRVSNQWSLQFSRKMFSPDKTMAGVLVVSLDPKYFSRFYSTLAIGQGSITLIGTGDGIVRAHEPMIADDIGQTANQALLQQVRDGPPSGTFEAVDQFDGVPRIYSYRRLDRYGMAVVVGLATTEVLAKFVSDARTYVIVGVCVTLLVLAVGAVLLGQRRRLVTSREQLTATLETIEQGIMMVSPDGRAPIINRRAVEILGLPPELLKENLRHTEIVEWQVANQEFSSGSDAAFTTILKDATEAFTNNTAPDHPVYERTRPDGTVIEVRTHPMQGGGAVRSFTDVTSRRQAERDLQLAQNRAGRAERMEAIGQLTGGIAHDFNNLLAVIVGNLDMLREATAEGSEPRVMVTEGLSAALHGASLVSQLLAFARKLPLAPKTIDINEMTTGMVLLLKRTLGGDIVLTLRKDPGLKLVTADPSQLESAILNLAINARDAMPSGGTLQIETRCVTLSAVEIAAIPDAAAGDHVLLSVSDIGTGMSPEVLARVFDPFFSTKPEGRGTGLGLSMVYGFTHQSGGHIIIDSAPGVGTTVRLYLPRAREASVPAPLPVPSHASLPRGHEVILVVDDNMGVRRPALRILSSLGYMVLEAESGQEALKVLARASKVDLLFSDVVMPGGIDGPMLARLAVESRPGIAVLLTSGFTDPNIGGAEQNTQGWDILGKPYRLQELAVRVRQALDHNKNRLTNNELESLH